MARKRGTTAQTSASRLYLGRRKIPYTAQSRSLGDQIWGLHRESHETIVWRGESYLWRHVCQSEIRSYCF